MPRGADRERMLAGLLRASHLLTFEQLPASVAVHAADAGMHDTLIYLADLQEESLHLLTGRGFDAGQDPPAGEPAEMAVTGTVPGRAFQHGVIVPVAQGEGEPVLWWIPLLNGTERLGVLRVTGRAEEGPAVQSMRDLAAAVALLVTAKRGISDAHARLVRRRRMNVAAEMQWRLIPPRTCATDRVVISAVMEPAYEISGDAFDYAFSGDTVHLSVFDAMGHDAASGLTANLAVAACRNYRRQAMGLVGTSEHIEDVLVAQFDDHRFATGILADLDVANGRLSWISRGHHPPVIIRRGGTVELSCAPAPPMGLGLGGPVTVCQDQLEPGDRLLIYTDGITEARSAEGREFGLDRFTDFVIRHESDGLPVPETLRRLIRHHLDHHGGRLSDDATVLVVEWQGSIPYPTIKPEAHADLL